MSSGELTEFVGFLRFFRASCFPRNEAPETRIEWCGQVTKGGVRMTVERSVGRGLTVVEVAESRARHGANRLTAKKKRGFLSRLLGNLGDPIIRVLLAAVAVEVAFTFRRCNWFEVGGIVLAVLVSSLVSTASEYGSERAFEKLSREASAAASVVVRDGKRLSLPSEELVVGDLLLLSAGERVPADCVLLSGSLTLDLSALNGETRESGRTPGAFSGEWSLDDPHQLFSGAFVTGGEGVARVGRVGDATVFGTLASELQTETRESPLKLRLSRLAKQISRIGYLSAGVIALSYLFRAIVVGGGFSLFGMGALLSDPNFLFSTLIRALTLSITVIVVAVPEGLPMMITVVLSSNMRRMMRDHVLVKKPVGIETAGSMNILFTDKTGTLTEGKMKLTGILTPDGLERKTGEARRESPRVHAVLALSARFNREGALAPGAGLLGNATERAAAEAFTRERIPGNVRAVAYVPFSSERKFSAVSLSGDAPAVLIKGAPEYLIPRATKRMTPDGGTEPFDAAARARFLSLVERASSRGARVIAVLTGENIADTVEGLGELTLAACLLLSDRVRRDAKTTVETLRRAGIRVVMVTGDNAGTASSVAQACGLCRPDAGDLLFDAAELRSKTDPELSELLPRIAVVCRAVPSDKTRLVRLAQAAGLVVGMTGDGINDAPARRLSDVGFAMGGGTSVAREAGDVVLLDNSIASVAKTVLYGRTVFSSIRKFITFQLMMNLAAVGVSLIGQLLGLPTPITIVQMLWVNLIMDTLGGLMFAGEAPLSSRMREKPKRRDEPILNGYMKVQIAVTGGYTLLLAVGFLVLPVFRRVFGYAKDPGGFLSAFFVLFVFAGLFNCVNARTERLRLFAGMVRNRLFLPLIALISAIQLLMVYRGGELFRTVPLEPRLLLRVILLAFTVVPADLVRKYFAGLSGKDRFF